MCVSTPTRASQTFILSQDSSFPILIRLSRDRDRLSEYTLARDGMEWNPSSVIDRRGRRSSVRNVGRSQDQRRRERERGFLTVVVVQRGKIVKRGIVLKITNDFAAGLDVLLRSRCFHSLKISRFEERRVYFPAINLNLIPHLVFHFSK